MKILAAIRDISFVKKYRYGYIISKVKKYLVYDPRIVRIASCDIEKEIDDDRETTNR